MLSELHSGIQSLLREHGRLNTSEIDIRFNAPTPEQIQRLTRPTINFFLFDLCENTDLRQNNFQSTRENGRSQRRLAPRRIDLYYMVSVLTTQVKDEHLLLWHVLATLMKYHELPADLLSDEFHESGIPVITRAAQPEDLSRVRELWNGLGAEPHPSIVYVITAPMDLDIVIEAPLVLTRTTRYSLRHASDESEPMHHIGGVVRRRDGSPLAGATISIDGGASDGYVTDNTGQFVFAHVPTGPLSLHVNSPQGEAKTVTIEIPSGSYDVVID